MKTNQPLTIRLGNRLTKLVTGEAISKSKDKVDIIKEALNERYSTKDFENPREIDNLISIYNNASIEQRKNPGRQ